MNKSCVYLVGAGPGDPDLLTVKALRVIKNADVVVYDRLVSKEIIDLIPIGVAKIYVGKEAGYHALPQEEINQLLVNLAQRKTQAGDQKIVRLKGGDPFIFGRGSEEATVLAEHKISFEIIPGITAAVACPAYVGIPLTHRGLADGVQFITGHRRGDIDLNLNKGSLGDINCTLSIYMGLGNLESIVSAVIDAGRPLTTPVAVIEQGTTVRQRHVISCLSNVVMDIKKENIVPPAMIVIGEVVTLAKTLEWFEPVSDQELQQSVG